VADNSHERLWRLLAEHSLHALDFAMADKAFVRCSDYQGVQFTKQVQQLMVTRFAASLRTDISPQPKEAQPPSHAPTSD
jgi:hypothetical protein